MKKQFYRKWDINKDSKLKSSKREQKNMKRRMGKEEYLEGTSTEENSLAMNFTSNVVLSLGNHKDDFLMMMTSPMHVE